jgi:hypothetical protein
VGTGEFGSVEEACAATIREADSFEPRASEQTVYARGHAIYRAMYPALRPIYSHIV